MQTGFPLFKDPTKGSEIKENTFAVTVETSGSERGLRKSGKT